MIAVLLSAALIQDCTAQDKFYEIMPMVDGKVSYINVLDADSITKDKLFSKLKDWAVNTYGSQIATLQAEDKETGYLAYKGFLPVYAFGQGGLIKNKPYTIHLYHTLKFYIKDGKYKIVFDDLHTYSTLEASLLGSADRVPIESYGKNGKPKHKEGYKRDVASFHKSIYDLFDSIKKSVNDSSAFDF